MLESICAFVVGTEALPVVLQIVALQRQCLDCFAAQLSMQNLLFSHFVALRMNSGLANSGLYYLAMLYFNVPEKYVRVNRLQIGQCIW